MNKKLVEVVAAVIENENNEILERKDINIFIETKIEQNNDVAEWSEATINKIKQVIRKILIEAGIIEDIKNGKIHKVKMSNWLKQYLIDKSEEKYVLALGETI